MRVSNNSKSFCSFSAVNTKYLKEYIAKNIKTNGSVEIPANDASVIVELPAGTELELKDGKIIANKQNIISYN